MAEYKVKGPDGQIHVIAGPEGASDAEITAQAQVLFSAPEKPGLLGQVWDKAKNAAKDLGRGALSTLEGYAQGGAASEGGPTAKANLPEFADKMMPKRQAAPGMDSYAQAGLEGLGGGLLGPVAYSKPALNGLASIFSGMGGHAGSELGGGPIGSIIGSLLGGGSVVGANAAANSRNAGALAREALKNVPESSLDSARQRMVDTQKTLPAGLNVSQAMQTPSNIDDVVNALAQQKEGTNVIKQLRDQPQQLHILGKMAQAGLPGEAQAPQMIANRAQDAATSTISDLQAQRAAAVQPLLGKAKQLPEAVNSQMVQEIEKALKTKGATPEFISSGRQLLAQMTESPRTGQPTRMPQDVQAYLNSFSKDVKDTGLRDSSTASGQISYLKDRLQGILEANSPQTAKANAAFKDLTENIVDPAKKGIVGQVAGVTGSQEDRAALSNRLYTAFERGTPDPKNSDIMKFELTTRKSDPTVFIDAGKSFISDKLNAIWPTSGSEIKDTLPGSIKKALAPNEAQLQGLRDILAGMARGQGVQEGPVVKGFMNFVDAADYASKRPVRVSGLPMSDIEEVAGKSAIAGVLTSATPGRVGYKVSKWYSADAKTTIDTMLTTPEGLDKLRALAKLDPRGQQAQLIIAGILGAEGSSGKPTQ
jgi:hypothetical protein